VQNIADPSFRVEIAFIDVMLLTHVMPTRKKRNDLEFAELLTLICLP